MANNSTSGQPPNTSSHPVLRDMDLGEWINHQHEIVSFAANRLNDEIVSIQRRWLTQHIPQMVEDNPSSYRLAVFSAKELNRLIFQHIDRLQLIASEMKEEMVSRFPQLNQDFDFNSHRSRIHTLAPTPPREDATFINENTNLRASNFKQNFLNTGVAAGTGSQQVQDRESTTRNDSTVWSRQDLDDSNSTDDDRSSESSSATLFMGSSAKNEKRETFRKVDKTSKKKRGANTTAPKTVAVPATNVDGLEELSEYDDDISIAETEIMSSSPGNAVPTVNLSDLNSDLPVTKGGNPKAASNLDTSSVEIDVVEEVSSNFPMAAVPLTDTIETTGNDFECSNPSEEVLHGPDVFMVQELRGTASSKLDTSESTRQSAGESGDQEYILPDDRQDTDHMVEDPFSPIILKTETVTTSSQESDSYFQQSTPGYAKLFSNPNDLETVDDEMPSTSTALWPRDGFQEQDSKSRYDSSSEDDNAQSVDVSSPSIGTREKKLHCTALNATHTWLNLIKKDFKLKNDACVVVMEILDAILLKRLRKDKYIILTPGIEDMEIENSVNSSDNDLRPVRSGRQRTVENPFADAIRKLAAPLSKRGTNMTINRSSTKRRPRTRQASNLEDPASDTDFEDISSDDSDVSHQTFTSREGESDPEFRFSETEDPQLTSAITSQAVVDVSDLESISDKSGDEDDRDEMSENTARNHFLRGAKGLSKNAKEMGVLTKNGQRYFTPNVEPKRSSRPHKRLRITSSSSEEEPPTPFLKNHEDNEDQDSGDDFVESRPPSSASNRRARISYSNEDVDESEESSTPISESVIAKTTTNDVGTIRLKKRTPSSAYTTGDEWEVAAAPPVKRARHYDDSSLSDISSEDEEREECIDISSGSDSDSDIQEVTLSESLGSRRKNIRAIMDDQAVDPATRRAEKEEEVRKRRVQERNKQLISMVPRVIQDTSNVQELILDRSNDGTQPEQIVEVDKSILLKFKPHQREGLKFIWDTCVESISTAKENPGTGCIIAHCMGLGKTVQALGFIHTVLTNNFLDFKSALVVCPKNTMTNWTDECTSWLQGVAKRIEVFDLWQDSAKPDRAFERLRKWGEVGGLAIIHYDRFKKYLSIFDDKPTTTTATISRAKGNGYSEEISTLIKRVFFEPGPDIVVFDEGHLLKNHRSKASLAANKITTKRRIILTGTPLQNNLEEYYTMVSLVKPKLLGTHIEFSNRFGNPIKNGAHIDSSEEDVATMKRRSHVLHSKLDGVIQRFDFTVMQPYLPPKSEYTVYINLSAVQKELYEYYTRKLYNEAIKNGKKPTAAVLSIFGELSKICTHPSLVKVTSASTSRKKKKQGRTQSVTEPLVALPIPTQLGDSSSTGSSDDEVDWLDGEGLPMEKEKITPLVAEVGSEEIGPWYKPFLENERFFDEKNVELSGKLVILMEILKVCERLGEKVLIFSQYLSTLDLIESYLEAWDAEVKVKEGCALKEGHQGVTGRRWRRQLEYFRLDGSTKVEDRKRSMDSFNKGQASKAKAYLISTRAGSLGINLTGANRVVIFDASWNPAQDLQSIFRVYRFGQTKHCYVYRLLSHGTLEEKIYNNQVVKLSLAGRVVDEQQIARHFEAQQSSHKYLYDPTPVDGDTNSALNPVPCDRLLADLLVKKNEWIYKYVEHDSLLADRKEEELTKEERDAAMAEYKSLEEDARRAQQSREAAAAGRSSINSTTRPQTELLSQTLPPRPQQLQTSSFTAMLEVKYFALHPGTTGQEFEAALQTLVRANRLIAKAKTPGQAPNIAAQLQVRISQLVADVNENFGNDVQWFSVLGATDINLFNNSSVDDDGDDLQTLHNYESTSSSNLLLNPFHVRNVPTRHYPSPLDLSLGLVPPRPPTIGPLADFYPSTSV